MPDIQQVDLDPGDIKPVMNIFGGTSMTHSLALIRFDYSDPTATNQELRSTTFGIMASEFKKFIKMLEAMRPHVKQMQDGSGRGS